MPISMDPMGAGKPSWEFWVPISRVAPIYLISRKRAEKAVLLACLGERRSKSLKEEKVAMFQAKQKNRSREVTLGIIEEHPFLGEYQTSSKCMVIFRYYHHLVKF